MNDTTEKARHLTREQAKVRTAELIAACPNWCHVEHEATAHPEDICHRKTVSDSLIGMITIEFWPVPIVGSPSTSLYIADHDGLNLSRESFIELAETFRRAAAELAELTT